MATHKSESNISSAVSDSWEFTTTSTGTTDRTTDNRAFC